MAAMVLCLPFILASYSRQIGVAGFFSLLKMVLRFTATNTHSLLQKRQPPSNHMNSKAEV